MALKIDGSSGLRRVVCEAPVNIAVIKYWGKKDEDLIIPLNDSISVTLSTKHLRARTVVSLDPDFNGTELILNGKVETLTKRLVTALDLCKSEAVRQKSIPVEELNHGLRIVSENNFPTAAGLASSAAGFACLVCALKELFGLEGDVSGIVRQGSGSACRSVYGGFVRWITGLQGNGSDSIACQVRPASHWPELRILILVVNDQRKDVTSTDGMKESVETSELLKYRSEVVAPRRCEEMTKAIEAKDFSQFAELTMRDSNQFHAVCLDTYPPIFYLNAASQAVIQLVHKFNQWKEQVRVAYSFDAGPNPFLFALDRDVAEIIKIIRLKFPNSGPQFIRGLEYADSSSQKVPEDLTHPALPNAVHYIISTKPGEGPSVQKSEGYSSASHLNEIHTRPRHDSDTVYY